MKSNSPVFHGGMMIFILLACHSPQQVSHNSQNSVDWQGTYTGILPCADCDGILTMIQLNKDGSYVMSKKYLGKSDDVRSVNGSFSWDDGGGKIILGGLDPKSEPIYYKVGENNLTQMDLKGNPVDSPLAEQNVLRKSGNDITNKYWKLTSLMGRKVEPNEQWIKEPHMILRTQGNRVSGHGGCNNFGGVYELPGKSQVKFSQMAATKMFCAASMEVEDSFLTSLQEAVEYTINGDSLNLFNDQKKKSATFVNVYLK